MTSDPAVAPCAYSSSVFTDYKVTKHSLEILRKTRNKPNSNTEKNKGIQLENQLKYNIYSPDLRQ